MAKQSGMQRYAEQFAQAKVEAAQRLISQYMTDTLQMTLHQTEGWGYERIMRLTGHGSRPKRSTRPPSIPTIRRRTSDRSTWIGCWRRSSGTA